MLGYRLLIATQALHGPTASAVGVGHGLQSCESLRRDDKKGFRGIKIAHRFGEVGTVDVGDKTEVDRAITVILQCLVGHHRTQVGSADSNVDDVADSLPGMT